MVLEGWLKKKETLVVNRLHTKNYPDRDMHKWAKVLLKNTGRLEFELSDIKKIKKHAEIQQKLKRFSIQVQNLLILLFRIQS